MAARASRVRLPETVSAYKRTTTFTKSTVPKGLLARHNTKKDTWGLIVVQTGSLSYTVFGDDQKEGEVDKAGDVTEILSPGKPGVIEPQVFHKVALLSEDTTFYVEFYAKENADIGVPKFMKDSEVRNVESRTKNDADAPIERLRGYLIQLICVGVLAVVVNFVLVKVSDIKHSASYNIPVHKT